MSDIVNSPTAELGQRFLDAGTNDAEYQKFERLIAERVASLRGPLFTTDASGLFEAYLAGIPGETRQREKCAYSREMITFYTGPRQHYNCRHCRQFIERYCGLVTIEPDGRIVPALWVGEVLRDRPRFFAESVTGMYAAIAVRPVKVTGVFVNSESVWGTPHNVAGPGSKCVGTRWTHLHGTPDETKICNPTLRRHSMESADQRAAELKQDFILLKKTLADVPTAALVQAVRVLESDEVQRAEKALGAAKWLLDLSERTSRSGRTDTNRNLVWLAVATAPPGFCHSKNNVLGPLLDDIREGRDFNSMRRRWNEKMDPLQYQRAQVAPNNGQIEAANRLFEKMGLESALARRYATLDDVVKFEWHWTDSLDDLADNAESPKTGRAFDHLRQKPAGVKPVELPPKAMTWQRFAEEILHSSRQSSPVRTIEVQLTGGSQPFYGLTTACDPASKPMLQWDGLLGEWRDDGDRPLSIQDPLPRNQVAWYFWDQRDQHGRPTAPDTAMRWGLERPGTKYLDWWQKVDAVFLSPPHWQQPDKFTHHEIQVFFAISAARDSREAQGGYFAETLRSDLHGVRKTIEAHAKASKLEGKDVGNANGIALTKNSKLTVRINGGDQYILSL